MASGKADDPCGPGLSIPVDVKTDIQDAKGVYAAFFQTLRRTMLAAKWGAYQTTYFEGDAYQLYADWFQDHMYVQKAARYFHPFATSGTDLFAAGQREDGMVHDNYKHPNEKNGPWSRRFDYGNFVRVPEDTTSSYVFVRVPVENMAEFTFIESIYRNWKESGDTEWMKGKDPKRPESLALRHHGSLPVFQSEATAATGAHNRHLGFCGRRRGRQSRWRPHARRLGQISVRDQLRRQHPDGRQL